MKWAFCVFRFNQRNPYHPLTHPSLPPSWLILSPLATGWAGGGGGKYKPRKSKEGGGRGRWVGGWGGKKLTPGVLGGETRGNP